MSERERWIVYPLLFLALGAALRDKVFNLTRSQKVVCESLGVFKNGDARQPMAMFGAEKLVGASAPDMINVDRVYTKYLKADQIEIRGRPLVPGGAANPALTQAQILRLLQSLGVLRPVPVEPAPPGPPESEKKQPER